MWVKLPTLHKRAGCSSPVPREGARGMARTQISKSVGEGAVAGTGTNGGDTVHGTWGSGSICDIRWRL
jgi:hypothetical protein